MEIKLSNDPDISIIEYIGERIRPLVSIEIKGGRDASNSHNRLGVAEKSHQKAKNRGFFEFWTIIGVDMDYSFAGKESPPHCELFLQLR
ncbi:XcyI family restriction endonuclease [Methanothrix sp.]|uniref:XcyI family restriction endonuclease n=1 Tax=Methanothrix sp. TaxID=90426 RepID=UPI003BB49C93